MNTVLFCDLDGTLVKDYFGEFVLPKTAEVLSPLVGLPPNDILSEIRRERRRRMATPLPGNHARAVDFDCIVDDIAQRFGLADFGLDHLPSKIADRFASACTAKLSGALEAVTLLRQQGISLVVATLGLLKFQRVVLYATGLLQYFDDVLAPDTTGYLKMDRRFYARYVTDKAIVAISVGDSFRDDVVVPHEAGFQTIFKFTEPSLKEVDPFDRPNLLGRYAHLIRYYELAGRAQPDAVIIDLTELPSVVFRMQAA